MSIKAVAEILGVTERTIRNQRSNGYALVRTADGEIDVAESVKSYVKHQSEIIRQLNAASGRKPSGNSGNTGNTEGDFQGKDWKEEKDKQAAIKMQLHNAQATGELVPAAAMIELYIEPLMHVKNKLLDLPNELQKHLPLEPGQLKVIDEVVRNALYKLDEKDGDELQSVIQNVIERHAKHYGAAAEDGDNRLDD
ncbi:terminase small subunit [Photobacterium atrarenae]|uniref:Terminase small subunit n=1 Tax=Photobacterium atrarenae TaxID=865757 RepID=A0ABY5GB43_9GAMM|nr:terminase small subunit [Photobacterium atrarenae]UTV26393.1 terminase small subunit [Photobacterium atrarenae]